MTRGAYLDRIVQKVLSNIMKYQDIIVYEMILGSFIGYSYNYYHGR